MFREDILSILREYKKQCSSDYGIIELGIFGSTARGEDSEDMMSMWSSGFKGQTYLPWLV